MIRYLGIAALGMAFGLLSVAPASATAVCQSESHTPTLSPIYTCLNGTTSTPGTFVGTVGTGAGGVTQIGNLSQYNADDGGAFVDSSANPSDYEFYWTGGNLLIQEETGTNGTVNGGIDAELFYYGLNQTGGTESLVGTNSINIPKGMSFTYFTLEDGTHNLLAGYYTISTYEGGTEITDPSYQVLFTPPATVAEPATLSLLGAGLAGMVMLRRRRKAA